MKKYNKSLRQQAKNEIESQFDEVKNTWGILCEIQDWFEYQPEWIKDGGQWVII